MDREHQETTFYKNASSVIHIDVIVMILFVICVGWNFEIASADLVLPLGMSLGHAIEELMILE